MNIQILFSLAFIIGFLLILAFCELLFKQFGTPVEYTRKLAHFLSSMFSLGFLVIFHSYSYVAILGSVLFVLLFVGKYFNLFKSIDSVNRKTAGSYLLPISIGLMFFLYKENNNKLLFILPILLLGISDPLAGIIGTLFHYKTKKIKIFTHHFDKTILGSSAFWSSSFIITMVVLKYFSYNGFQLIVLSFSLACITTVVEIFSSNGTDNITIPLTAYMFLISI